MKIFGKKRTMFLSGLGAALFVALAMAPGAGALDKKHQVFLPQKPNPAAQISVLTYNVKGLPWPVARDRGTALRTIGQRLSDLRGEGAQPHVVLLQEAFSSDAKNIAKLAGYRHVVFGPSEAASAAIPPLGQAYAKDASWRYGEFGEALADSGLAVLSDYPIVKVRRVAFPQGACAGLDCLAAKGVLLAWIRVPGVARPLLVGDTHLNSRRATRVSFARSNAAYNWQIDDVQAIIAKNAAADEPMILGGDFNIGKAPERVASFRRSGLLGPDRRDDISLVRKASATNVGSAEIPDILANNKVKLLSRKGRGMELKPLDAWVPFPQATEPNPLSDHAGVIVEYRISQAT